MNIEFKIVDAHTIGSQEQLVSQLCEIDRICFSDIVDEDEGNEAFWMKNRKASYAQILLREGIPVGYIDFLKVNESGLGAMYSGTVQDGKLEGLLDTGDSKTVIFYIPSICVLPECRERGLSRELWNASAAYFIANNFFIKELYAVVWTSDGEEFFSQFQKEVVSKDVYGHPIIRIHLEDGRLPELK